MAHAQGHAAKAPRKLAGPHLPASPKELEKAIAARAHREHDTTVQRARPPAQRDRPAAARAAQDREDRLDADQGTDCQDGTGELEVDDELEAGGA